MPSLPCHACGAPVEVSEPIPRDAECDSCGHDLRCCTNCHHYDVRYNNACRETQADPVEDKERRNFCEFFAFSRAPFQAAATSTREAEARARLASMFGSTGTAPGGAGGDARKNLESLFGTPRGPDEKRDEARKKLDKLFREPDASDDAGQGKE